MRTERLKEEDIFYLMHGMCIYVYHAVFLAHGNSKGEGRGRHKNNSKRVVRNEQGHEGEESQTRPNYSGDGQSNE